MRQGEESGDERREVVNARVLTSGRRQHVTDQPSYNQTNRRTIYAMCTYIVHTVVIYAMCTYIGLVTCANPLTHDIPSTLAC